MFFPPDRAFWLMRENGDPKEREMGEPEPCGCPFNDPHLTMTFLNA